MKRILRVGWSCALLAAWALGCGSNSDAGPAPGENDAAGQGGAGQHLDASSASGGSAGASGRGGSGGSGGSGQSGGAGAGGATEAGAGIPDVVASADASDAVHGDVSSDSGRASNDAALRVDASEAGAISKAGDARPPDGSAAIPDSATPYDPCPAAPAACVILPLGDSITDGVGSSGGGYRVELFRLAHSQGHNITFVGGGAPNGPATVDGVPFPSNHEGHSGFTIDDGGGRSGIQPLVVNSLTTFRPHIVTLMIGTNDINLQLDVVNAPMRLGRLIDTIVATSPSALLVVAQIVPSQDDVLNARIQTYNAAMPALVAARIASGKHVVLVDMYGAITANANYKTQYYFDRLHPNDAGYVVMAGVWYGVIGPLLR